MAKREKSGRGSFPSDQGIAAAKDTRAPAVGKWFRYQKVEFSFTPPKDFSSYGQKRKKSKSVAVE